MGQLVHFCIGDHRIPAMDAEYQGKGIGHYAEAAGEATADPYPDRGKGCEMACE
jgi:hypothetical protein